MCPSNTCRHGGAVHRRRGRRQIASFTALDNLIAEQRVPVMIAISIGNGSGDAQGSERGLEYDTMSGLYAEFVESEVLPLVENEVQRETDQRSRRPRHDGRQLRRLVRADHGVVSPRALSPRAHLLRHVREPAVAATTPKRPHGAWEFHEHLIPNSPAKPLRIWMEVGDRDLLNPNAMRDNMHDWVVANENMAKVLAAQGLSLPVRLRPQRRPLRRRHEAADAARSAGISVEGLQRPAGEIAA